MCGIIGIVGAPDNSDHIVYRMLSSIAHRGPDGEGVWFDDVDKEVVLGHRQLSILDLSDAGAQPMADTSDQYVIVFNGEIYNYLEIAADLKSLGVRFRSHCDTEVLLEAYKQWGDACLDHLNGMFAFAIYDKPRGMLFCARNRYGEKPFLFGSGYALTMLIAFVVFWVATTLLPARLRWPTNRVS